MTKATTNKTNKHLEQHNQQYKMTTDVQHPCNHADKNEACDCCNDVDDALNSPLLTNCDSNCCADYVASSLPLMASSLTPVSHPLSLKLVFASISIYTRHISPELQPPLV
jgi:hypothetical protein